MANRYTRTRLSAPNKQRTFSENQAMNESARAAESAPNPAPPDELGAQASRPLPAKPRSRVREVIFLVAFLATALFVGFALAVATSLAFKVSLGRALDGSVPFMVLLDSIFLPKRASLATAHDGALGVLLVFYSAWSAVYHPAVLHGAWVLVPALVIFGMGLLFCKGWFREVFPQQVPPTPSSA